MRLRLLRYYLLRLRRRSACWRLLRSCLNTCGLLYNNLRHWLCDNPRHRSCSIERLHRRFLFRLRTLYLLSAYRLLFYILDRSLVLGVRDLHRCFLNERNICHSLVHLFLLFFFNYIVFLIWQELLGLRIQIEKVNELTPHVFLLSGVLDLHLSFRAKMFDQCVTIVLAYTAQLVYKLIREEVYSFFVLV